MKPARHRSLQSPPPSDSGVQQPWLLSYADFITNVLACFVLLFSMVSLDHDKFQRILGSIPGRAHLDLQAPQPVERGMVSEATDPARSPSYLLALLKGSFEKDPKLATLELTGNGDRVIVTLPTSTLISELGNGGGAKKDGLLFALGGALRSFPNEIMVQGQGVAINDPDRWGKLLVLTQLSAAAIEQAGVPGPIPARTELSASGAASMQVNVIITERAADTTP
ncbi:flagellar motor protein MotB [Dongia deserti]|uniref:flagellar motor protein MotB n=1 Tax=Dongia deserti TaxID=2268030 RepID=UPI000E6538A6|nr:flagellar motor protein MotB [Dongia deserti]